MKHKLKVGYVIDDTLDSTDGVQQYILTLADYMVKNDVEVHFLTGRTTRNDLQTIHSLSKNIKVKFNKNRMSIPLPASPRKIAELLTKEQFDVLHIQMPFSPALASRVVDLSSGKTAIFGTFHVAPYSKAQHYASKLLGYYVKPTLQKFDKFYAVSPLAKKMANDTFRIDSEISPNIVNLKSIPNNKLLNNRNDFVFLGRLVKRKGCDDLINAFALFIRNNESNNSKLHICGDGPDRIKLLKLSKKLRINNRVIFHGKVSEAEKFKILGKSRIAIFPSTGGESFGIVLIEAMAAGAGVVLGADNPGYSDVLKNNSKYLFKVNDPLSISVLMDFYNSNERLNEAHQDQSNILRKFSVDTVGKKILNDYRLTTAEKIERTK